MTTAVANSLTNAMLPPHFETEYESVAQAFCHSSESEVASYLKHHRPDWHTLLTEMPTREQQLALESLLTWEATRQYRLHCIGQLLEFKPTIVGDNGWLKLLDASTFRHLPGLDYYKELSRFYPHSKINFNCTSRQMIGAVNQRVFDVPACGGFLLTDHREQMEDLFDLDSEVVVYRQPEEISGQINRFLHDSQARKSVTAAARKRILAHHTYTLRLESLFATMRRTFG